MSNVCRRPSARFALLCASYATLICFLTWGYQQPDLDRAWLVLQGMQRDSFNRLAPSEAQLLQRLLQSDSRFAHALVGKNAIGFVEPTDDGWIALPEAHLVVQASQSALRVRIESRAPSGHYPLGVVLETSGWQWSATFLADGIERLDIPPAANSAARWIRVELKSSASADAKSAPAAIRVLVERPEPIRAN